MGQNAVMGAMLQCTFGLAPSSLIPKGTSKVMIEGRPAATTMDNITGANIPPFGMCNSLANPTVAAATAAALGVLTPMPCLPVTTPWKPGAPTVQIANFPALNNASTCQCAFGGVITFSFAGQATTMIP